MPSATTNAQDESFLKKAADGVDVDEIIRVIIGTDVSWILEWVSVNCEPDEVFSDTVLEQWAEKHGYTKE